MNITKAEHATTGFGDDSISFIPQNQLIIGAAMVTHLGSCALTCLWHKLWYRSTFRKP